MNSTISDKSRLWSSVEYGEAELDNLSNSPKEIYRNSRSQCSRGNLIPNVCRASRVSGTHKIEFEFFGKQVFNDTNLSESSSTNSFLSNARRLDQQGNTDAALDLVFDQIDEMLLANRFEDVDQVIAGVTPDQFSVELLLGLLTVTSPAKNELNRRQSFFKKVEQALQKRNDYEDNLLIGLD